MDKFIPVMGPIFQSGTLASGAPIIQSMIGATLPSTVTLDSTAAGRLIEISTDDGANYFTPTLDNTQTNFINVAIKAPCSTVRITGQAGDKWSIR